MFAWLSRFYYGSDITEEKELGKVQVEIYTLEGELFKKEFVGFVSFWNICGDNGYSVNTAEECFQEACVNWAKKGSFQVKERVIPFSRIKEIKHIKFPYSRKIQRIRGRWDYSAEEDKSDFETTAA
jgi:hypothetical protein